MAKITVDIKGIAMIYHKGDGIWKILFPFDGCHTVKFSSSLDAGEISLAGQSHVRVITENPLSRFGIGSNYDAFLDMTADYMHEDGVKAKSDWQQKGVLLAIENAVFSVDEMTKSKYRVTEEGKTKKDFAYIGYSGKAEIESEKVTVEVPGLAGFPRVFDEDCRLVFDNDCRQFDLRETSDFQMFYSLIEDRINPGRQFTTERDAVVQSEESQSSTFPPMEDTNPAPDEEGLPCHQVIIGDPPLLP